MSPRFRPDATGRPLPVLFFSCDGLCTGANDEARQLLRVGEERFTYRDLYLPSEAEAADRDFARTLAEGASLTEGPRVRRDATVFHAQVHAIAIPGQVVIAILQPVSKLDVAKRLLFDQVPALVFTTDAKLIVTRIFGGGAIPHIDELRERNIGQPLTHVAPPDARWIADRIRSVLEGRPVDYTIDYAGATYDVRVEPLRSDDGTIAGTIGVAFDVTERRRAQDDLRASREELRNLAKRMNVIQEEERKRAARDIHDEMGHRLVALRLELDLLAREIGEAGAERVAAMRRLIGEGASAARRIAAHLRPPALDDLGFRGALEADVAALRRRANIDVVLDVPEEDVPLSADALTALYRIVQEALTNIARHSGAKRATVSITTTADAVCLQITDDGRSLEPHLPTGGLGLVGARERALSFGGELEIESNGGTRVTATIPLAGGDDSV